MFLLELASWGLRARDFGLEVGALVGFYLPASSLLDIGVCMESIL